MRFPPLFYPIAKLDHNKSNKHSRHDNSVKSGPYSDSDSPCVEDHGRRCKPFHFKPVFQNDACADKSKTGHNLRGQPHWVHHDMFLESTVFCHTLNGDACKERGGDSHNRVSFYTCRLMLMRPVKADEKTKEGADDNAVVGFVPQKLPLQ